MICHAIIDKLNAAVHLYHHVMNKKNTAAFVILTNGTMHQSILNVAEELKLITYQIQVADADVLKLLPHKTILVSLPADVNKKKPMHSEKSTNFTGSKNSQIQKRVRLCRVFLRTVKCTVLSLCTFLYSKGVTPVASLNFRLKYALSRNPEASAASLME